MSLLVRTATLQPASYNEADNTIGVIWSTGADYGRRDSQGPYTERLSLDPAHVRLDRLRGANVLDSHQQGGLTNIIGAVTEATVDGRQGSATIKLSSNPDRAGIVNDIRSGVIRNLSVGYKVAKWEDSTGTKGERVRTATDWEPHELSFVAVPADPGARVRSGKKMKIDRAELNTQIRTLAKTAGLSVQFADELIDRGASVKAARAAAFDEIIKRQVKLPAGPAGGLDNSDPTVIRTRMVVALAHRLGCPGALPEDAVQYRGLRLARYGPYPPGGSRGARGGPSGRGAADPCSGARPICPFF